MQTSPNSNKPFLFINKSGQSAHLSRSLPLEKAAVQRHVQTGRKRSRNPKHTKSVTVTETDKSLTSACTSTPAGRDSHLSGHPTKGVVTEDRGSQPRGKTTSLLTGHSEALHDRQGYFTSLNGHTILSKYDPFDVASIPIDRRVSSLLHYYLNYYHPSQWPNEMTLLRHGVYMFQEAVSNIMKAAIQDKLVMYCLLGSASCRLQFIDRLPLPSLVGTENYYLHQAVQLMASYITTCNLQNANQIKQFLICIVFLSAAEAYRGDLSASGAHLSAAVELLKPYGGVAFLKGDILQGQLAMADLFLACVHLRPCLFDCAYDPGPAESLELLGHELVASPATAIASRLLSMPEAFISPGLRIIIAELVESHTVKSRILTTSMSPTRALQVTHWITLRNMAIRNKLLSLDLADQRDHSLRIAIIMWTLFAMNVTGRAKTVKVMAPELRKSLVDISPSSWIEHEDVKLWIVSLGLYCASEGSETALWFMNESFSLIDCCIPAVASVRDLAERLEIFQKSFLFDVSVQRARTYVLAEKLYHTPS